MGGIFGGAVGGLKKILKNDQCFSFASFVSFNRGEWEQTGKKIEIFFLLNGISPLERSP